MLLLGAALHAGITAQSQTVQDNKDHYTLSNDYVTVVLDKQQGQISYQFRNGIRLDRTIAYFEDEALGMLQSTGLRQHSYTTDDIQDPMGQGICLNVVHEDVQQPVRLIQHITLYKTQPYVLISAEAEAKDGSGHTVSTRHIAPLALLQGQGGRLVLPGQSPRLTDFPFDNDNWVDVMTQAWPASGKGSLSGISHELIAIADKETRAGLVAGSITHDCWKTGIRYSGGAKAGTLDSLVIYGGVSTPDQPSLPASLGGYDGTHDVIPHGLVSGASVQGPLLFLGAGDDARQCLVQYGSSNALVAPARKWAGPAPVYWNSFGVEGVLGYEKVMMPAGVLKVIDELKGMQHLSQHAAPVISIDSYDQSIYTTNILRSIGQYARKKGQQIGFYFIPFANWNWANSLYTAKLQGSDYLLSDVVLRDNKGEPVPYKKGDWSAFPLDPTHPATRQYIIYHLQRAKAIGATFIKIDFLSAGALESVKHHDPRVTTGIQAYNYGMKLLRQLTDSIMGPDVFFTMAISPMFPHQYAHTRFVSTDVYSHFRNDQAGFPHYGSTAASMISATHLWWIQGTLWPYTNMDVAIMKHFQKNPDLSEGEVKVRLFSMITLGSILGDGSDLREPLAVSRARQYLNHPAVSAFFSHPRAFTPLSFPEGNGMDQQLRFFLPGDTLLLSAFNFQLSQPFAAHFSRQETGLKAGVYEIRDFLTDKVLGTVGAAQETIELAVPARDALLVKVVPLQ